MVYRIQASPGRGSPDRPRARRADIDGETGGQAGPDARARASSRGFPLLSPVRLASRPSGHALIVIDPTDIRKLYAKKMEYLARVGTRSTGDRQRIQRLPGGRLRRRRPPGSRRCTCGCGRARRRASSARTTRCSASSTRSKIPREEARHLRHRPQGDGDWLFDGLDRRKLDIDTSWATATLLHGQRTALAEELAASCPMKHIEIVTRETGTG